MSDIYSFFKTHFILPPDSVTFHFTKFYDVGLQRNRDEKIRVTQEVD